jgi:hypothetical protein
MDDSAFFMSASHLSSEGFLAILSCTIFFEGVLEEALLVLLLRAGLGNNFWVSLPKQIVFFLLGWLEELATLIISCCLLFSRWALLFFS